MRHFPSPSEGVGSEDKIKDWINENGVVHPHRPAGNYGPPTALFNPALAKLRHNLKHLDQVEEPTAGDLEWTHKLLVVCSNGFRRENTREGELKAIIDVLMDKPAKWQVSLEGRVAIPDAVWSNGFGDIDLIRMILELKNTDGVYGNATLQALLDYAKTLSQPKVRLLFIFAGYCFPYVMKSSTNGS